MGMPKSVVKINKDGVEYISSVDRTQYTMLELERAGLRDVGKLLKKVIRPTIPKDEGWARKSLATWVRKPWRDQAAHLQIGIYNAKTAFKKGIEYAGYYFHILEFGSREQKPLRLLTSGVQSRVDAIRMIMAQYLKHIEDEQKAKTIIDEKDEVED